MLVDYKVGEIKKYTVSVDLILDIDCYCSISDITSSAAKHEFLRILVFHINSGKIDAELIYMNSNDKGNPKLIFKKKE